jgi:ribosomal protein S18 acetylase RimI-like enzyme
MTTGMIRPLDLSDTDLAERVQAMQQGAYAIEAALIDFWEIPPLVETLADLQASVEHFWGYFIGEELAGAIATEQISETVEVTRMMVHPRYFRQGIARQLLAFVAATYPTARLTVSTGSRNTPAVRLYEGIGFVETERAEVAPGIWVTRFEKRHDPHSA